MTSWKNLTRHPLSAEYRDLAGAEWTAFTAKMQRVGFLMGHPIIIHDEQVLDGWQRMRSCIELDIEPVLADLPSGIDPQEYVESVNDRRRHESKEEAEARVEARRKRVAAAKECGQSLRAIAATEGISHVQAKRDIDSESLQRSMNKSGVTHVTPDNQISADAINGSPATPHQEDGATNGKVVGRDGKSYPATKPAAILCEQCQRAQRVGQPLPKKCPDCKALRNPKPDEEPDEPEEKKPKVDGNGVLWAEKAPKALVALEGAEDQIKEMGRQLSKMASAIAENESLRLYTYSMQSVLAAIRTLRSTLIDALPAYVCPYCDGSTRTTDGPEKGKACEVCCRQGWVSKSTYKRSPKGAAK